MAATWVFLGRDYEKYLIAWAYVEKNMPEAREVKLKELENSLKSKCVEKYTDFVTSFLKKNRGNRSAGFTHFGNMTNLVSPFFEKYLQIESAQKLSAEVRDVYFICEHKDVAEDLRATLSNRNFNFSAVNFLDHLLSTSNRNAGVRANFVSTILRIQYLKKLILKWTFFILREALLKFIFDFAIGIWRFNVPREQFEVVLHRSLIFDKNKNSYFDPYFGILHLDLQSQQKKFLEIPWFLGSDIGLRRKVHYLKNNPCAYPVLHFITWAEFFAEFVKFFLETRKLETDYEIESVSVKEIMLTERTKWKLSAEAVSFVFFEAAMKRISARSLIGENCKYLDILENMFTDKQPKSAFLKYFPKARFFGYVHTLPTNDHLNYTWSNSFCGEGHHQETILTAGIACRNEMIKLGYPSENIVCVESTKFEYLRLCRAQQQIPRKISNVLLLMPMDIQQSLDFAAKVVLKWKENFFTNSNFVVRFHPAFNQPKKSLILGVLSAMTGCTFAVSSLSLLECFEQSDLVLGMSTGALLDACIYGIPTVSFSSSLGLSFDPLFHWKDEFGEVFADENYFAYRGACSNLEDSIRDTMGKRAEFSLFLRQWFLPSEKLPTIGECLL